MRVQKLRFRVARFKRHFIRFTWGGAWAAALPEERRQNLTLFFYDGLFSAASDKIILTYMTVYLLTLGAARQQIGLLSSLSNLAAAILLIPAAMLVERTGERKRITLIGAGGSRVAILLMALLPMFLRTSTALIWVVLGLALLREAFANLGFPGWMALTGDIIPLEGRGRYFGTRNFIMGVSGIITALVIGEAITRIGSPLGYQLAFLLAVLLGIISMAFFGRLKDPTKENRATLQVHNSFKQILQSLKGQRQFIIFCFFTAVWNFSINIAGPFFNVYMVDTLKMTAALIGLTAVADTIAHMLVQRRVGALADKWGNRNVAIIFLLLIPVIPLVWGIWVRQPWQAIMTEAIGGIMWGAYSLVSFNIILLQTPEPQRARFSAFYQMVVTLALAGGAALGSFLIPVIDFRGVALTSAGGRWLAALLFILLVKEHRQKSESTPALDT